MENFALIVPGLIAFGEVLKRIFGVRSKLIPVILLVVGVTYAFVQEGVTVLALLAGTIAVATALGVYSGVKATRDALPSLGLRTVASKTRKSK